MAGSSRACACPSTVTGHVHVRDPGGALPGPYVVCDLPAPPGFHAAVAVEGMETFTVQPAIVHTALLFPL